MGESMPEASAGAQTTTASVLNMAVDADTTLTPAKNNNAVIFYCNDVSFDQWLQFQIWKSHDEDRAQFINISSK